MLFRGLFPEDERLTSRAHNADADVQMTSRIVESYFQRVRGAISNTKNHQIHPEEKTKMETQVGVSNWNFQLVNKPHTAQIVLKHHSIVLTT
jgi:hypothetical protein